MIYLLLICQLTLAIVLLLAATGKFLNAEQFLAALRLSHLPRKWVMPIAVLTPTIEVCLAIVLVLNTPQLLPLVMLATVILFSIFTLWMISVSIRGLRLKCGCFGAGEAAIGPGAISRNILLIAITILGLVFSLHTQSLLPKPSFWMVIIVFSFGMCLILIRAFQQGKDSLVLSTSQLERLEANAKSNSTL